MKPKAKEAFKIDADNLSNNKKIVFSDDESGNKKEKLNLFDDNDDEDCDYDISEIKKSKRKIIGNDERFTIDKEHLDEDEEPEIQEPEDEDDLAHEKKKELEILGAVLGKPVLPKPESVQTKKTSTMVRYDPTVDDHHKHEIKTSKEEAEPKKKSKKKKKDVEVEEKANEEPPPPPVNEEIFYSVSDKLTESLQKKEEFSVLKAFGSNVPVEQEPEEAKATAIQPLKVKYNIKTKNPFKYDSSDDEDSPHKSKKSQKLTNEFNGKFGQPKNFFFTTNDPRFQDAEGFFKTTPTSDESFKNTRRELKQIVRSKIRNNVRKTRPWKTKVSRVKSIKK